MKDPAESILKLKILDPAMGSGHFLVGAVDYLSDRILEILAETSDKNYFGKEIYRSPLIKKLENIRTRILEKAKKEGYIIDETQLEDKNLIKRIILKRCIYGVDVNPLAVELAKVSLWLHTFTIGAPLSFLDHHLKCGNSLIGANPEDFEKIFEKRPIFGSKYTGLMNAVAMIEKLQEISDTDISEVEESAKIYNDIVKQLEPYKKLLNVYTAEFFLRPKKKSYFKKYQSPLSLLDGTKGDPLDIISGKVKLTQKERSLINDALELARRKRFFHWKLEFPEIWYEKGKEKANGGFDVVIGNPPYVRIQEMRKSHPDEVDYYKQFFESPAGSYDIYILFVEKGFSLLKSSGILGYILPNKFTRLDYGKKLRKLIGRHLFKFIDFGDNQIFPEQTTYTGLLFVSGKERDVAYVAKAPGVDKEIEKWLAGADNEMYKILTSQLKDSPWILVPEREFAILKKIESRSIRLENFVDKIIVGIQTSADDVYILEKLSEKRNFYKVFSKASGKSYLLEKDLLKPLISGEDIERYFVKQSSKLLLFPYRLLPEGGAELIPEEELKENYPETWKYLKEHEQRLRNREGGKFNDEEWYRFGRTQNLDKQERPKFGIAETVKRLEVFFDEKGKFYFHNVRVNGIIFKSSTDVSPYYLLALLNSKVLDFYFKRISVPHRGGHFAANKQFLAPLPVARIDFKSDEGSYLESLKNQYEKGAYNNIISKIYSLPSNSAVLHDFLSFLAKKMIELNQNKYLLQLFIENKLTHGTDEMIKVMGLLQEHPQWKDKALEDYKKEIALNILKDYENRIAETDELIDRIVYHLYGLKEEDINIIIKGC